MFSQGLAQQGALQTVGEQKQTLGQKALDEQYFKFLEQKAFPEEQLAKYSGFVYGNPLLAQRDVTSTAQSGRNFNQPSSGAQLLGAGLAGANAFRQIAPQTFGSITGNVFGNAKTGGGLSDIVYRQDGGNLSAYEASGRRFSNLPQFDNTKTGRARAARAEREREEARQGYTPEDLETEGGINSIGFSETIPSSLNSSINPTMSEAIQMTGTERGDLDDLQDLIPRPEDRVDPRFDPEVVQRRADERERSREGFYSKSDKERRSFNKSMADRRRSERDADYQRRRGLIGEADPMGTLLSQLSQSLLRTREDDGGFLSRVGEGLNRTTSKISEADKARNEKLLKVEDEFGRRRAEESEKEFEAEGQMLSRGEEREALALAREFKLEDKILDLPYAKQRKALELINAGLKGEKLKAEIEKLRSESGGVVIDADTLNKLEKAYENQRKTTIPGITMEGTAMSEAVQGALQAASSAANKAYKDSGGNGIVASETYQRELGAIRKAYNEGRLK